MNWADRTIITLEDFWNLLCNHKIYKQIHTVLILSRNISSCRQVTSRQITQLPKTTMASMTTQFITDRHTDPQTRRSVISGVGPLLLLTLSDSATGLRAQILPCTAESDNKNKPLTQSLKNPSIIAQWRQRWFTHTPSDTNTLSSPNTAIHARISCKLQVVINAGKHNKKK